VRVVVRKPVPQPPPPSDCTAVVESPARMKYGGFVAFGRAKAEVARREM
jgi:hypothetical protein